MTEHLAPADVAGGFIRIASGIGPVRGEAHARALARVYRQPFTARLDKAVRAQSIRGRTLSNRCFLTLMNAQIRIEAGCTITSVSPKSAPLNSRGARMTAETA